MVNVVYRVKINQENKTDILEIIKNFEYDTKETKDDQSSHCPVINDDNTTNLICSKKYHPEELDRALDLLQVLKSTDGVIQIAPMFISKKSKTHFIAIPVSAAVTFLTVLGVVYGISPNMPILNLLFTAGLPAGIIGGAQLLYRVLKWI